MYYEHVYAFGASIMMFIQDRCSGLAGYWELVNRASSPSNPLQVLLPMVAAVDSVFAAQLVLCIAVGSWANAVIKWLLIEERPYWWVHETDYYDKFDMERPQPRQSPQTCELGPGCPSGHTQTAATLLMLGVFWTVHVMYERKCYVWWWKLVAYPVFAVAMASVMVARVYVGAHFLHQTLVGALLGVFLTPTLCIYVADPYIWRVGWYGQSSVSTAMFWHCMAVIGAIGIGVGTYLWLLDAGYDPLWTLKLARKWCQYPETIKLTTTPLFALVHSTAHLLGWALCVTPGITKYRHNTKDRSLLVAALFAAFVAYVWNGMARQIPPDSSLRYFVYRFVVDASKPLLLLRFMPWLAMHCDCDHAKLH